MVAKEKFDKAEEIVAYYTLLTAGTGAFPVPAASAGIIGETGFMISHVAAVLGAPITWQGVVSNLGVAGALNVAGQTVFLEGAKALSWGTGSVWALAALCALGATTAGVQTYIIGRLAIEMGRNGGYPLPGDQVGLLIKESRESYKAFTAKWQEKKPRKPDVA